jgi:hypothetical protein
LDNIDQTTIQLGRGNCQGASAWQPIEEWRVSKMMQTVANYENRVINARIKEIRIYKSYSIIKGVFSRLEHKVVEES